MSVPKQVNAQVSTKLGIGGLERVHRVPRWIQNAKKSENKRFDFDVPDRIASIFEGSWERFWECLKYSSDFEPDIYN
jgi:hypothetical protein